MNFFDAQDQARRATRWLVVVYVIATILIVAGVTLVVTAAIYGFGQGIRPDPQLLGAVAIAATLLIVGATLYRTARLSSGGGRVATEMGGTKVSADITDPLRQRLRNVVEEMAIASGVPVPEIYVLEREPGINAFAAGFTPGDAAVAVTRGTLELLDRDELQGVVAHEFSHILNGDMRLNIRMMGVLFGIMVINLVGRMILRGGYHSGASIGRRNRNSGGVMALGLGLAVLGWIGVFFARLIKAAVSRQREYLADASAVQFTRQTDGIANALKKIGGFQGHSYLQAADAEEVSHMLFALGAKFSGLFATHPPLADRIRALDPSFDPSRYPPVRHSDRRVPQPEPDGPMAGFAPGVDSIAVAPQAVVEAVGRPGPAHVGFATALRRSIPEELESPAHSPSRAYLVALALLVDPSGRHAARQFDFLRQQLGAERASLVERYYRQILEIGPLYRLPLLEISFPALKLSPLEQLEYLLDLGRRLIEQDGEVDFHEFCFYRILARTLSQAADPSAPPARFRATRAAVRDAAVLLLTLLADRGHDARADKQRAFAAGLGLFGRWAGEVDFEPVGAGAVGRFEASLDVLAKMGSAAKQTLLKAVTATVVHDGRVTIAEAEMIRAICASLDCPLPPLIAEAAAS